MERYKIKQKGSDGICFSKAMWKPKIKSALRSSRTELISKPIIK
jgi:hypothetical protein